MNGVTRSVAGACALLAMAAGCRQVLGVDGYGTTDTCDAPPGTFTGKGDIDYSCRSCRDCVDHSCSDIVLRCADDPACEAMAQCLAKCEPLDSACRGKCNLSIPRTTAFDNLVACEANHCTQCTASLIPVGTASCDACVIKECPDALATLSKSKSALALDLCQSDCPFSGNDGTGMPICPCAAANEAASNALAELNRCTNDATMADGGTTPGPCKLRCNDTKANWSCLDSVQWPPPPTSLKEIDLHLQLISVDTGMPLSNMSVSVCASLDCGQLTPVDQTDPQGWVSLPIVKPPQLGGDLFFGYLEANDTTDIPQADKAPALIYFFPPVRKSLSWTSRRVVSKKLADSTLTSISVPPDWTKGGIVFSVTSCVHQPAEGVTVTVEGSTTYYFEGLAVKESLEKTSSIGLGFIANLVGQQTIHAEVAATEQRIGDYSVQVNPGSLTHVTIAPAPRNP